MQVRFTDSFYKSLDRIRKKKNPFSDVFWIALYKNIKHSTRSALAYFRITPKMRDWDYIYIIQMMRFQIKRLHDHIEKHSYEVERDKTKKLKQMERAMELLDGMIEDNYLEKAGWDQQNYNSFYEALDDISRYNEKAHEIEQNEWQALWKLLSNCMRGWWW